MRIEISRAPERPSLRRCVSGRSALARARCPEGPQIVVDLTFLIVSFAIRCYRRASLVN